MTTTVWKAPTISAPISAEIRVPGSKSQTNRALVLAALSQGPSSIVNPLRARDTLLMKDALKALGVHIEESNADWQVTPRPLQGAGVVQCGLAGTVMRFLPIVAALANGDTTFEGDAEARVRPMSTTLQSLRQLGIRVSGNESSLPFTVHATGKVSKRLVDVDASASSQFVSALLLAGARFDHGIQIHHQGDILPSLPHIDMSIDMLKHHGVDVETDFASAADVTWRIEPSVIQAVDTRIQPDLSNALVFLAAAMVSGGSVTIKDWPHDTTQPGARAPHLLQKMGAKYRLDEHGLTIHGPEEIVGLDENLSDVGELTPVLVAIASLASSPSHFYGIGHLRGHETNRLQALVTEFSKCGAKIKETADGLTIEPSKLYGSQFNPYNDHRMVMAASVLGLRVPEINIINPQTVSKTLPEFTLLWNEMLGIKNAI